MGDNNNNNTFIADEKLSVILIGVGSAAFVMTIYHCLAVGRCNGRRQQVPNQRHNRRVVTDAEETPVSIETSTAQLIPSHKYQKGMMSGGGGGGGDGGGDGTCAVCLGEFEEGEEVRTLPECLHSYHAPCIDMWLYSHSSCPMCRTDAVPSPQILRPPDSSGSEDVEAGMLRNVDVQ